MLEADWLLHLPLYSTFQACQGCSLSQPSVMIGLMSAPLLPLLLVVGQMEGEGGGGRKSKAK